MNQYEAREIIERLKTDGLLSDNEVQAIDLLTSVSVCHCKNCVSMQRSPKGDTEFFCSMHHKFFQEEPGDQFCSWGRSKTLFESLSDDLKDTLDKAIHDDVMKSAARLKPMPGTVLDKSSIKRVLEDIEKHYPMQAHILDYINKIQTCRECKYHFTMTRADYSDYLGYHVVHVCKKDDPMTIEIENINKTCEHFEKESE